MNPTLSSTFHTFVFSPCPLDHVLRTEKQMFKRPHRSACFLCCMPHADGLPNTAEMSPEALEQQAHNLQESELACLVAPAFNLCLETLPALCQGPEPSWKHCALVFSQ